jgi:hypothetical protein
MLGRRASGAPKLTRVRVAIGGMQFRLPTLTLERFKEIVTVFSTVRAAQGVKQIDELRRGLHAILHDLASCNGSLEDEAIFEEWCGQLPLLQTVDLLVPKIVESITASVPPRRAAQYLRAFQEITRHVDASPDTH